MSSSMYSSRAQKAVRRRLVNVIRRGHRAVVIHTAKREQQRAGLTPNLFGLRGVGLGLVQ